ncbi:hypothetical protein INR49_008222 [Caranx melampygus]|nr:hypothetical protein INR49_008222 [Caranx melampygus]
MVIFPECSCDRRGTEVTLCPLGSPCFCDPTTGQCPCRTGVAGVLCDECEDGYWNLGGPSGCQPCSCEPVNSLSNICNKARPPGTSRLTCDCNLEGTERPSCDLKPGSVSVEPCAPGYSSEFPACEECHPCTALWAQNVIDVQRATQRMRTFIPRHGDDMRPGDSRHQQQMLEVHLKLDNLTNLTGLSPPMLEKVEKTMDKDQGSNL